MTQYKRISWRTLRKYCVCLEDYEPKKYQCIHEGNNNFLNYLPNELTDGSKCSQADCPIWRRLKTIERG